MDNENIKNDLTLNAFNVPSVTKNGLDDNKPDLPIVEPYKPEEWEKSQQNNLSTFAAPDDVINGIISGKVIEKLDEKSTEEKLNSHAGKIIKHKIAIAESKLNAETEKAKTEEENAMFERNINALKLFAMGERAPSWLQKAMKFVYDFFCVLWFIICIPTIAPVMFISFRLQTIIKNMWATVIIAIIIYLIIILVPILLTTI